MTNAAIVTGILYQAGVLLYLWLLEELPSSPMAMSVSLLLLSIVFYGCLGILFYVPARLIERSSRCSTFVAAMLCVVSVVLPAAAGVYVLAQHLHLDQPHMMLPPNISADEEP